MMSKKEVVSYFLNKGFLLSKDFLENLDDDNFVEILMEKLNKIDLKNKVIVLNKDFVSITDNNNTINVRWDEFEKALNVNEEKIEHKEEVILQKDIGVGKVIVKKSFEEDSKKRGVLDFVNYFRARYNSLKKILLNKPELQTSVSINRVRNKIRGEEISIIGVISRKNVTKNGNILLGIEDPTGEVDVLINKNRENLQEIMKEVVLDEVIGITGSMGENIIFVKNIYFPGNPINKELKKAKDEAYAVFISDLHVGSNTFKETQFKKMIDWFNAESGNAEIDKLSDKIQYLFLVGDLVDGVGEYPGQEKDLNITDIYKQYDKLAEMLSKVPKSIKIVICGGNHDAIRIAEPQPPLDKNITKTLVSLPNVTMVSNPALVNIHSSNDFSGFDVLLYHGFSYPYYFLNLDHIRTAGGIKKVDEVMKLLLQKRHLAPVHTSTQYIPTIEDNLVIDPLPDIFVSGHVHKAFAYNYKNISLMCCGCWMMLTPYQERRGIVPEYSRAVLVNLKTRDMNILDFN